MHESDQAKDHLPRQNRREFLKSTAASALFAALHPLSALATPATKYLPRPESEQGPFILSLHLRTSTPLTKMKEFYEKVLGLPILSEDSRQITIGGGGTPITFELTGPESGDPWYHVAFNIPENKVRSARNWQIERTPLDPNPSAPRDPDNYPRDVVHFRNWNAHSVFFRDPAGNLLEYIGRHDLRNSAPGPFSSDDILYASEIVFVVEDVPAAAMEMKKALGLSQYRQNSPRFEAIGDAHGLLLVMKRGVSLRGKAGVFPTVANIRAAKPTDYAVRNFPYQISVS